MTAVERHKITFKGGTFSFEIAYLIKILFTSDSFSPEIFKSFKRQKDRNNFFSSCSPIEKIYNRFIFHFCSI